MRVGDLQQGDRVEIDIRGRIFPAVFDGVREGRVWFLPLSPGNGYRACSARQVRRRLKSRPVQPQEAR